MRTPYKSKSPLQEAEDFSRWAPLLAKFNPSKMMNISPADLVKERPAPLRQTVGELIYRLGAELESAEMNAGKLTGPAIRAVALQDLQALINKLKRL